MSVIRGIAKEEISKIHESKPGVKKMSFESVMMRELVKKKSRGAPLFFLKGLMACSIKRNEVFTKKKNNLCCSFYPNEYCKVSGYD